MNLLEAAPKRPNSLIVILRWVAVLPAAAAAGYVGWLLIVLLNRISFSMSGVDPDSFLGRAFIEAASSAVMGAAIVYAGAKTAPSHRRIVVFVMAVLALVSAGVLLYPALLMRSGWAIYSVVWWILGAGGVAWSVYSGETTEFFD